MDVYRTPETLISGSGGQVQGGGGCTTACPQSKNSPSGIGAAAGSTLKPLFIPMMTITCYYQEVTPGEEHPDTDIFLGCQFMDFYGNFQDSNGPDGGNDAVAIHGGKKDHDGCASSPETINDPINMKNGVQISVNDINVVMQGGTVVGWMYRGSDGVRYYQANYATQTAWSFNVNLGFLALGGTSPGGYGPVVPWQGQFPPGSRPYKCFTNGSDLVG